MEKAKALRITRISPVEMLKPSVMQSKYIPQRAKNMLIHNVILGYFLKKIPMIGTMIIYNAVRKPAFEAVV